MTNSVTNKPNTNTGTEDQTSPVGGRVGPDRDEKPDHQWVNNKGVPFDVQVFPNGLFYIRMIGGGLRPSICEETFTSRQLAEWELTKYIAKGAKITGEAKFPGKKEKNGKSTNDEALPDVR